VTGLIKVSSYWHWSKCKACHLLIRASVYCGWDSQLIFPVTSRVLLLASGPHVHGCCLCGSDLRYCNGWCVGTLTTCSLLAIYVLDTIIVPLDKTIASMRRYMGLVRRFEMRLCHINRRLNLEYIVDTSESSAVPCRVRCTKICSASMEYRTDFSTYEQSYEAIISCWCVKHSMDTFAWMWLAVFKPENGQDELEKPPSLALSLRGTCTFVDGKDGILDACHSPFPYLNLGLNQGCCDEKQRLRISHYTRRINRLLV